MYPSSTAALFTTVTIWKKSKCPSTEEWLKKMRSINTMEYYSAIKKNEIMPFSTTWMEISEISQTEKNTYYMISSICEI